MDLTTLPKFHCCVQFVTDLFYRSRDIFCTNSLNFVDQAVHPSASLSVDL